ncbi:MAG: hypothetical protein IKC46_13105 [Lachnospiraceae bacterium]|nr:hypothetical protein [Lachnospiraceae bacterium]
MNLQKLEFTIPYDKADFYARTGIYFAEKKYRHEMPYLVNSDEKEWCLFYDKDKLAGFYAHEPKDGYTLISGLFIPESHRHTGICEYLLTDITLSFGRVRMTTSSPHLIKKLLAFHFVRISSRGSYQTMERTMQ